jgi:hypothetical protein
MTTISRITHTTVRQGWNGATITAGTADRTGPNIGTNSNSPASATGEGRPAREHQHSVRRAARPTRKGARAFVAERVFVTPDRLYLDRREPDGVELIIGHLTGPQGPRSVLSYHEYVEAPAAVEFTVLVAEDAIPRDRWPRVWTLFEQNGLGATRSQGFGTFDLVRWDPAGVRAGETSTTERHSFPIRSITAHV